MAGIKLLEKKPENLNLLMNLFLTPDVRHRFFDDRIGWQDITALLYDPQTVIYGVFEKGHPVPIGAVVLAGVFPFRGCTVNGIIFDPKLRSQHKMKQVALQVLSDLVQTWQVHHVEANTIGTNAPAEKFLESLGFSKVGVKPKAVVVNGKYEDLHVWYALVQEDLVKAARQQPRQQEA